MLKVVIVGYGEMFTNLIAASMDAECEIVGVLRNETIKYNPLVCKIKDIINPSLDYNYIKSYNLPEIKGVKSVNSKEFRKKLLELNPDIMLVGSWGEKIKKETYSIPKIASINAHPSLLPKYRGPNPYFWTIRNLEEESGVSFHLIDDGYDTGAILAQEIIKIYPSDTGESLKKRTVLTARGIACELLKTLREDMIIPLTQIEEKSSYYSYPEGLELDFSKPSYELHATIRAIHPWGRTWFYYHGIPVSPNPYECEIKENDTEYKTFGTITDFDSKKRIIAVLCGDNKILKMSDIELYNKLDKPFTSNFIEREVSIGETIAF